MEASGIGTVVMFAVAAGLWFLYFVPTWLKRREYLATERTATRLQQTLRVMAETAETPEVVHVEATMRDAFRQERALRAQERAERRRFAEQLRQEEAAERAADRAARVARVQRDAAAVRRRRVRRSRTAASVLMVASTAVGVVQIVLIATTGAVTASWLVLAAATAGACVAVGVQRRLDGRVASRPQTAATPVVAATVRAVEPQSVVSDAPARAWTPVPLPKPRYLDRPAPQPVAPRIDAAVLLRAAAEEAERARRVAHAEPEVVPFRPRAAPTVPAAAVAPVAGAPSRYARMGLVGPADTATTDLDEVLRRRRSAG